MGMKAAHKRYEDLRPIPSETVYHEYDTEFNCWAVFGDESGFCYAQPHNEEKAIALAKEFNDNIPGVRKC